MNAMPRPEAVRYSNVREGLEAPVARFGDAHVPRLEVYDEIEDAGIDLGPSVGHLRSPEIARALGTPALRLEAVA